MDMDFYLIVFISVAIFLASTLLLSSFVLIPKDFFMVIRNRKGGVAKVIGPGVGLVNPFAKMLSGKGDLKRSRVSDLVCSANIISLDGYEISLKALFAVSVNVDDIEKVLSLSSDYVTFLDGKFKAVMIKLASKNNATDMIKLAQKRVDQLIGALRRDAEKCGLTLESMDIIEMNIPCELKKVMHRGAEVSDLSRIMESKMRIYGKLAIERASVAANCIKYVSDSYAANQIKYIKEMIESFKPYIGDDKVLTQQLIMVGVQSWSGVAGHPFATFEKIREDFTDSVLEDKSVSRNAGIVDNSKVDLNEADFGFDFEEMDEVDKRVDEALKSGL